ncbi:MAG TPA: LiaF domain-containing protein [Nannocystaceae bacterium]|nr:LiaF domain-containing protein [Nannocystaceae bacterium]
MTDSVNLVALERVRAVARERIGEGYALDLIDADELDRRLDALERAATAAEVEALVADLVPPAAAEPANPQVVALVPCVDVPERASVVAMFSETKRVGQWLPGRANDVRAVFASVQLDLREAHLGAGTTYFHATVVFGELEIIVPPGLAVDVDCNVMFGEVDQDESLAPRDSSGMRVRVDGRVWFGSVTIRERLVGESKSEARKRRKAERKRLAEARKPKMLRS